MRMSISAGFDVGIDAAWSEAAVPVVGADFMDVSASFPNTAAAGLVPFSGPGPNGNGILLATLSFASSAAGLFDLAILSDLSDPNEGLFTLLGTQDLTYSEPVTVNAPASGAPEPTTLALMGIGAAGIWYKRRRWIRL